MRQDSRQPRTTQSADDQQSADTEPVAGKRTRTEQLPVQRRARHRGALDPIPEAPLPWFEAPAPAPAADPGVCVGPGLVVQCQVGATGAAAPATEAAGTGAPLPDGVRTGMEQSFGADFSAVRVHQDASAQAMGALAYTQGHDIHFGPGQYDPGSGAGRELIGHELTHVVQQSQGRVAATAQARGVDLNDDPALEREADEMGGRAARGEPAGAATTGGAAAGAVQRKEGWSGGPVLGDNTGTKTIGHIKRVPLQGLSSVGALTKGRAIALVPDTFDPDKPAEVLLHMHGWNEGWAGGRDSSAKDQLVQQLEASGRTQMIGLLPQGTEKADFSSAADKARNPGTKGFDGDAFIAESMQELVAAGTLAKVPQVGNVVMSAHSGGGQALGMMLEAGAPEHLGEVILFDAINGAGDELPRIEVWLRAELDRELAKLQALPSADKQLEFLASSFRFRAYHSRAGYYDAFHNAKPGDPDAAKPLPANLPKGPGFIPLESFLNRWFAQVNLPGQVVSKFRDNFQVIDTGVQGTSAGHDGLVGHGKLADELRGLAPTTAAGGKAQGQGSAPPPAPTPSKGDDSGDGIDPQKASVENEMPIEGTVSTPPATTPATTTPPAPAQPAPPTVPPLANPPTVRMGSSGDAVKRLQELLNQHGAGLSTDGKFGPMTRSAVVSYQKSNGLTPDGIVGPMTWGAIQRAVPAGQPPTEQPPIDQPVNTQPPSPGGPATAPPGGDKTGGQPGADTPAPADPPAVADPVFAQRGQAAIAKIKAANHASSGSLMRGEGSSIHGFPAWFIELQDLLSLGAEWKAEEEEGQKVLEDYATWYCQQKFGGKMPPALAVFFRYIGRSQKNVNDAAAGGFRNTAELGGAAGAKNWCQNATTAAADKALAERGLKFKHGALNWLNSSVKRKQGSGTALYATQAYGAPLEPGDWVSYFYQGCQHGGHAVTAVEDLGDSFLHVSGNTGGVGGVRLQESRRLKSAPPGFKQAKAELDSAYVRSVNFGESVLVWCITRASDVWRELEEIDTVSPSADPAAYEALLNRLDLARIK